MKWLHIIYDTIWFRCHPIIGPVAPDDPMPVVYFSLREAFDFAKFMHDD